MTMQLILGLGLVLVTSGLARADNAHLLVVGEQASVAVEPGTRFSVGNGDVIQVRTTQVAGGHSLLLVKGKSQGYSDLILLEAEGGKHTLAFRVVSKKEAYLTQGLRGPQTPPRLHPLERVRAESRIRRLLLEAGLNGIDVRSMGGVVLLYGDAGTVADKDLAETLAREILRDVRSQVRVPFERGSRLRFHAKILEVLREGVQSLGLKWADEVPNALQVGTGGVGVNLALDAALRLLERRGQARLLAQPQILLNERGAAELQVGGEIPIPVHTRFFSAVQWKQYGLLLHLDLPGVSRDLARAHIVVEISTLDPANGADGVPAMRLSKMDTDVDLRVGSSVLLSGLLESRQSRSTSGLPFLSHIPVLGELFRSHDYQENRSELVIVLEAEV